MRLALGMVGQPGRFYNFRLPRGESPAEWSLPSNRRVDMVLRSAIANANEQEADVRSLYVVEARVDGGPFFNRFRPKDRGRAHPILKRTSHLVVVVGERKS